MLFWVTCTTAQDVIGLDGWPVEHLGEIGVIAATNVTVDEFSKTEINGFSVYVEKTLETDSPEDVETLLLLVDAHLTLLENMVSAEIFEKLRTVNIWATDNSCGNTAAFYHRKTAGPWLELNGRPTEMAGGTEFCRVDVLVSRDRLSAYLIHELAHGFHEHYLTDAFDNQVIIDAYDRQWPLLLYYNILQADGDHDDEGHANSNAIEYFAHLSNKYLGTDGEYPFVQGELRHHDNWGWQIADAVWTNGTLASEWLDCTIIGSVRSGYESNRIRLKFVNKTDSVRYLIWMDQHGEVRWDYNEWVVDAGETQDISSRRTHLWVVFDEHKECVGVFRPGFDSETVEIVASESASSTVLSAQP